MWHRKKDRVCKVCEWETDMKSSESWLLVLFIGWLIAVIPATHRQTDRQTDTCPVHRRMTELTFYVQVDTTYIILETFWPVASLSDYNWLNKMYNSNSKLHMNSNICANTKTHKMKLKHKPADNYNNRSCVISRQTESNTVGGGVSFVCRQVGSQNSVIESIEVDRQWVIAFLVKPHLKHPPVHTHTHTLSVVRL